MNSTINKYKARAGKFRPFAILSCLPLMLTLVLILLTNSCVTNQPPPHIFIIMIDAARYDLMSQTLDNRPLMKSLHQFSTTASNYTYCLANAPYTGPSVATILSGLYPETHSVRKPGSQASDNTPFLHKRLAAAGYHTTIITGNAVLLRHHLIQSFADSTFIRPLGQENSFAQSSRQNIDQAKSVIQQLDFNRPQFVYVHLLPPHEPYNPPVPWDQLPVSAPNKRFAAYLRNAAYGDHLTGQLLEQIKNIQQFDNALIIVGSDHGEAIGEHGHQGHITTVYNETLHVPLMIKLPHQTAPKTITTPCGLIDITPTILEYLNLPLDPTIQGRSLPTNQKNKTRQSIPIYSRAVGEPIHAALVDFPFKYIHNNGKNELYNLDSDPNETNNVALSNPSDTKRLQTSLFSRIKQNLQLRTRLRITPTEKRLDLPELMKELKTLGYL